jgi:hypothetical protein
MEGVMPSRNVDIAENTIRGMLVGGITPKEFFSGLHNAFFQGSILEECNIEFTDKQLGGLFEHFDALSEIAKKLK